MDEVELYWCHKKIRLHQVQDLGARYKFAPLTAEKISAEQVAAKLQDLFTSHGAPLVLKRDNGPALNGQVVDAMLEKHRVIPLNSPAYYPPYNGGMERAQRELKECLLKMLSPLTRYDHGLLESYAAAAASELNHKRRKSLRGKTSCEVFQSGKEALKPYNRRRRKEVFAWIKNLAVSILTQTKGGNQRQPSAAWRVAVETWLRKNDIITVFPGKSVTQFPDENGS
jgi:transposase InsO family protein